MPKQKKVAIIGNISSFDKCSITTALPIFAASGGIETYPLLTAIVASRDNDIDSPDYCDLTNNMPTVAEYWRSQQLKLEYIPSNGCSVSPRFWISSVTVRLRRAVKSGSLKSSMVV